MRANYRRRASVSLITIWGLALSACSRLPSDDVLLKQFSESRRCLDEIVAMARSEKNIERVSSTFVRLSNNILPSEEERKANLSNERWDLYRALFGCARVPDGIGIGFDRVYFYAVSFGFAGSGQEKGYLWISRTPAPIVANLDIASLRSEGRGSSVNVYRHIEGSWYLELSMN